MEHLETVDLAKASQRLSFVKDSLATIQSLATILAFIAAGWWFFAQGNTQNNVKLESHVSQRPVAGEQNKTNPDTLIIVEIDAKNTGKIASDTGNGEVVLFRENPQTEAPIGQYSVQSKTISAGQSAQVFLHGFVIHSDTRTIMVSTTIRVPYRKYFWSSKKLFTNVELTSVVDIGSNCRPL